MKRILAFILALTTLITPQCFVMAESKINIKVNETYNDTTTHTVPKSITTVGDGSVFYVKNIEQGKALYMRHRWVDTSVKVNSSASNQVIWIDTSVMLPDLNTSRNVIEVTSGSNTEALVAVDRGGRVLNNEGEAVGRVMKNEWHRFTVELNLITKKYDIYIDGSLRGERSLAPSAVSEGISSAGFTAKANAETESELYNKYFRVYTADKIPSELEIDEAAYNHDSKKLKKDEVKEVEEKVVMYYDDDFEDIAVGGRPDEITPTIGTQTVKKDDTGNYYSYSWEKGLSFAGNYEVSKLNLLEMPENIVFECDVRIGKNSDEVYLYSLRDAQDPYKFSRIVTVKEDGKLTLYDGTALGANCKNKWVSVAIINNFKKKTHDIYINGELKVQGAPFQDTATSPKMSMLRFWNYAGTDKGNLDIDNMRIYSGSRLIGENEDVASGYVEMPEKTEVWEHEISDAQLNINMSAYKEAPVYKSDSPSVYLTNFEAGKNAFNGTICIVSGHSNIWIKDRKYTSPYNITWDDKENFLAPAEFLASLTSETVTYSNGVVKIGSGFSAKIGEKSITVGDTAYETKTAVCDIDGKAYIPVYEYAVYKLKKYCSESYKGMAVISDKQLDLHSSVNTTVINEMLAVLALDLPNKEALRAAYEASSVKGVHPRMYKTQEGFEEIIERSKTDPILKELLDTTKNAADSILNYKFTYIQTSGVGSYSDCEKLYIAWLMTGDDKYATKAEELALLISNDDNWWEADYYLATSANMMICATVYDLFYDYLSDKSKDIIANAAIEKGIKAAQRAYAGKLSDWPQRKTNWNTVPNGGGMFAAATFLGEGYDDEACLDVLEKSFVSLSYCMHVYAPYGSAFESIGYFAYGTGYLVKADIALNSVFGTDFGISNYTGYNNAGYFVFNMQTVTDAWALHDDTLRSGVQNSFAIYFANKTHDLTLQKMRLEQIEKKYKGLVHMEDVVYYMSEKMPDKVDAPLDVNYSYSELAASRSDWGDTPFYLGVHAGANNFEHGQEDLGNFIYEAFGLRFAHDVGRDDYGLAGYFNAGTLRENYYTSRAEGHNVYVINPDESAGQLYKAKSEIVEQDKKSKGVIYTVDMTPAYYEQLVEAKRGYMLTNDRSVLVIQDEIVPLEEDDEYKWFWTTEAEIEIVDKKTIILTSGSTKKKVTLYFDSNVDFELTSGITEPLPTSPNPAGQLKIGNTANKITATFYAEEEAMDMMYFRCVAVPYGHDDYEIGEITPISEWSIPEGDITKGYVNADKIYVNGKELKNFSPETYDYTEYYAEYEDLPTVSAEAGAKVEIRQAEDVYKTAVVTVTSASGVKKIYTVTFQSDIANGLPDGVEIPVKSVEAMDDDGNVPENVLDNDFNTRWSGKTVDEGWIQFDLGEVKEIDAVALAIYVGNTRAAKFDILVSKDGVNYTEVIKNGRTSGTTTGMEHVKFKPVNARYVKLIGYGATTSRYNSYSEIHIYKTN